MFQYKKAMFFHDTQIATEILRAGTPNKAKALSYKITDFDQELWKGVAVQTLYTACAKYFKKIPT